MTEEELKKEAEKKAAVYFDTLEVDHGNVSDTPFSAYDVFVAYEKGAMYFAEPREKQIEIDAEQIRALQRQNGELTDNLTKAKEIIKIFLKYEICTLNIKDELADNIAQAEQFLKETK